MQRERRRLVEVDRVTGFAIFLVVVGHVVAREPPADAEWYVRLKLGIYLFHMPLFMFLSGVVFQHTRNPIATPTDYRAWATKKIARLAPGFFLIGSAIVVGKSLARGFLHVDNARTEDVGQGFLQLLVDPTSSAAGSLWYIYVLLELYLLFPLLLAACRENRLVVSLIVVSLHAFHLLGEPPTLFAFHEVCEFSLYFWGGVIACTRYDRALSRVRQLGALFVVLFAISFGCILLLPWKQSTTVVGLLSIPAMFWLVGHNRGRLGAWCAYLAGYTFVIYLLNTIVIGVTKGLMLKLLPWDGVNFFLYFAVLLAAGVAAPILAYRWVFARNGTLARIMN